MGMRKAPPARRRRSRPAPPPSPAGATSVTPLTLHLRPGAREWFMAWLERRHPHLVRRYERLYADGAYAPTWYQRRITRQVHEPAEEYGIGPTRAELPRRVRRPGPIPPERPGPPPPEQPGATQLSLI
ncbi:hypothetical protein GCM10010389_00170 [Streptomyces echinoruber]|uniref:Uncharacterized protein n=1 Tax=Streptomyces echinoruber TaxID=68898 RepID=A0A918V582_9ACTN|nr:hypothetical protein GCM10010389_00170 [Streptomyces echinoruber]